MDLNALRYSLLKKAEGLRYQIPNHNIIRVFDDLTLREYIYSHQKKGVGYAYDTIQWVLDKIK